MRRALSIMLAVLLASPAAPAKSHDHGTVKEQVLNITQGAVVEVRLADKTRSRGRLGPVSDSGFELQTMRDGKIVTAQIAFGQVTSIKDTATKSFGHSVSKGFLISRDRHRHDFWDRADCVPGESLHRAVIELSLN